MTFATGSVITADDFNGFRSTIGNVYGVGSGDHGYGQTAVTLDAVTAYTTASSTLVGTSEWSRLRAMMSVIAQHQGAAMSGIGQPAAKGNLIAANSSFASLITTLSTNRLIPASSSMSLTTGAYAITRATAWKGQMVGMVDADFSSEDAARFFFNSGGQIRLRFDHPTGTAGRDAELRNSFLSLGTFKFGARIATMTGSATTGFTPVGFYDLDDTSKTLFDNASIGTASTYASDVQGLTVQVKRKRFVGTNNGNGAGVRFIITLNDTGGVTGSVSGGTQVSFDHLRATTVLSGVEAPVYTTFNQF